MTVWREGGFVDNIWVAIADDVAAPAEGAIVVSLERWLQERESLTKRAAPVGVEIAASAQAPDALPLAADRPLIALRFDKFADGRAFSYAILLRQRHGFAGDLRAVGDVLLDEIPLMLRCGFTSFEPTNAPTLRALQQGHATKFPLAYQPGLARGETPVGTHPRARRWG